MDFVPVYDADGIGSVQCGNRFYPPDHVEFRAWLQERKQKFEDFLAANPPPPKVEPTWEDKRLSAYRAEADPLLAEAMYQIHIQGIEPAATAWAQKQAEIRSRYPKEVK